MDERGRSIKYGPYSNVKALEYSNVFLHFKKDSAMPIFTEVTRTIEISHWGNINVEEHFEVFNEVAGVKNEWGRVDYNQYDQNSGRHAIKNFEIEMPRYIRGLYYYDFIGNISSSHAYRDADNVKFYFEPRFPIFGQWKTDYNIGYNMPTKYHLFYDMEDDSKHLFNFTLLHDFDGILAENFTLKVILPEGATDVKAHLPFEVDSIENGLHFSTLDYLGRPVLIIKKDNVISHLHKSHFQVTYTFKNTSLLIEPIYVIAVLFVMFLFAIFCARFDMNLDQGEQDNKVKKE